MDKKDTKNLFDATMGSFEGAETCELVGTYILSLLPNSLKHNTDLYHGDELAACHDTPRNTENIKKRICARGLARTK